VSELQADILSPIDAATLWPQLHRLDTEVVATRVGDHLLLRAGLAATGLGKLPKFPRTAVLGIRRGLSYRGVMVSRELAGGAAWEGVSLRIARETDDDAVTVLISAAGRETARRGGRIFFLRYAEGSPHEEAILRGGLTPYLKEELHALPRSTGAAGPRTTAFRTARRHDIAGVFRLYCRAVPESVRRVEAPTQREWAAVLDSYDCDHQHVADGQGALVAWAGSGEHEARILETGDDSARADAFSLVEHSLSQPATLVIAEFQDALRRDAAAREYTALGTRIVAARQLAAYNSLKEAARVRSESFPVPN
jgi:hypothetical protein